MLLIDSYSFEKADETYRMGIHRSAHPIDRLKRRYLEFQKRIIASEGLGQSGNDQVYKAALRQAMAKAQRAMLGSKVGSGSMSANTIRGFGGQGGLDGVRARDTQNGAKPSLFKDKDGEDVFARPSVKGGWSEVGTSASRKQETKPESKHWKGEVLPQREVITPKKPAIAVYRDSDEEDDDAPAKVRGADVFSTLSAAKEPSATDQLRRNPLLHYEQHEKEKKLLPAATKRPKNASSSSTKARVASTSSSTSKQENYAIPMHMLYPGIKLEEAGQKRSKRERSGEMCIEELLAKKRGATGDDLWSHLDSQQGRWLPEPKRKEKTIRRDATVTAFTREAQDQVMEMFNAGMIDSDDESSDVQSESEEEDDDLQPLAPVQMLKENSNVPPTPTPAPKQARDAETAPQSAAMMATPIRKTFGERKPFGERAMPQRLQEEAVEEEESDSETEEVDYLNAPMREMMPLSPITEATEYTRYTHSTGTPGVASRYYWDDTTPSLNDVVAEAEEEVEEGEQTPVLPQSKQTVEEQDHSLSETASESGGCGSVWAGSQWGDKDKSGQRMSKGYTIEQGSQNGEDRFNASLVIVDDLPNPCCPVDPLVTDAILGSLTLSIESSSDYVDCRHLTSNKLSGLQSRAQMTHRRTSSNSTGNIPAIPQAWTLDVMHHSFPILQKLGEGGYGAVFLAEDDGSLSKSKRFVGGINGDASFADVDAFDELDDDEDDETEKKLIAIKVETPPNRWEFYILGQLRARLTAARLSSIICARKFFCFEDESFLLLEYGEKGTLLEIVNNAVKAGVASSAAIVGQSSGPVGIDEILAMFFVVEIIKIVQSLHAVDLLHGDLKIDNCLLRLDEPQETWTNSYNRDGQNGWSAKGVTLIDFGRAINLRQFKPEQRFVADWNTDVHDCLEIQRGESWKYEIDYHGIASIAYCLLFGKYIEMTESANDGFHTIDKPLRRYWQVDLWTSLFKLCLNSGRLSREGKDVAEELETVRSQMESWLEENCFRAGKNLKGSLKKLEIWSIKRSS
jgi:checkpoint serine/threonine-protein kinase